MKTAKRLLTLALALCMLIGIPFAVSAADEFKIESVVEAPYELDWEQVQFVPGQSRETLQNNFAGKTVIVTFNNEPSADSLDGLYGGAGATKLYKPRIGGWNEKGEPADNMTAFYVARYGKNSIIIAHSNNAEKTFDIMRTTSGYTNSKGATSFFVEFENMAGNGDVASNAVMDKFTDVNNVPLSLKPNQRITMTDRTAPLAVLSVNSLADSEIVKEDDKGRIWIVKFNRAIQTNTAVFKLGVVTADGAYLSGCESVTCHIASEYNVGSDGVAIRTTNVQRHVPYFEETAAAAGTSVYGYQVLIEDTDTTRNYRVDSLLDANGESLPFVTIQGTNNADRWVSVTYQSVYGAKIGDTTYPTFEKAMAAAKAGETVTMLTDIVNDGPIFVLNADVKLDLNGYELTVNNYLAAFGHIVDSSDGEGKLVVSKDNCLRLMANNEAMPLYDEDGYRFFAYEFRFKKDDTVTNSDQVKYKFGLGFDNAYAYTLFTGADNADMQFGVRMSVTKDGREYGFYWEVPDAYMTQKQTIILTISGMNSLADASYTAHAYLEGNYMNLTGALDSK